MKKKLSDIELHVAGATVRHKGVFDDLVSYTNDKDLSKDFIRKWVMPFYMELQRDDDEWIRSMIELKNEITDNIILQNLGDFDWRTRSMGAYFASIMGAQRFTEIIGTHLLKSEVTYAGHQYAITLASFNTTEAIEYLNRYLDYYLTRVDLYFDQSTVLSAIKYLDQVNTTNLAERHSEAWKKFIVNKGEAWQRNVTAAPVAKAVEIINRIKIH